MLMDLLLACYLANANCAIMNVMTALIFVILIVSQLHAFFLVVPIRSSLHALVVVEVISYFQQRILQVHTLNVAHLLRSRPRSSVTHAEPVTLQAFV